MVDWSITSIQPSLLVPRPKLHIPSTWSAWLGYLKFGGVDLFRLVDERGYAKKDLCDASD